MSCDAWGERRPRERVEKGEEKSEGKFVRLKIKKAKEQGWEKVSTRRNGLIE